MRTIERVLVVEDNRALLRSLVDLLEQRYPEVRGARSVAAAHTSLEHWQPDLAILDVALPDGSALEVLNLLCRRAPLPVLIGMSGCAEPETSFALAQRGVTIDVTAFPVAEDEDAWSAVEAVLRYRASGAPPQRLTVSSDAGGCLPCFDADGRVAHMDVGAPGALLEALHALVLNGVPLAEALAPFTTNVAGLLRLDRKGRIEVGADADLVALDAQGKVRDCWIGGVQHVAAGRLLRRGVFETTESD